MDLAEKLTVILKISIDTIDSAETEAQLVMLRTVFGTIAEGSRIKEIGKSIFETGVEFNAEAEVDWAAMQSLVKGKVECKN